MKRKNDDPEQGRSKCPKILREDVFHCVPGELALSVISHLDPGDLFRTMQGNLHEDNTLSNICIESLACFQDWKSSYRDCKFVLDRLQQQQGKKPAAALVVPLKIHEAPPLVLSENIMALDGFPRTSSLAISFYNLPPTLPLSIAVVMFMLYEAMPFEVIKYEDAGEEDIGRLTVRGDELQEEDLEYLIGVVLSTAFDILVALSQRKMRWKDIEMKLCEKALSIGKKMSTHITAIYNNVGTLYVAKSRLVDDEAEKRALKEEAKKAFLLLEDIDQRKYYNLACVFATDNNHVECQEWLKRCFNYNNNTMQGIWSRVDNKQYQNYAMADPDFETVRSTEWFEQILFSTDQ